MITTDPTPPRYETQLTPEETLRHLSPFWNAFKIASPLTDKESYAEGAKRLRLRCKLINGVGKPTSDTRKGLYDIEDNFSEEETTVIEEMAKKLMMHDFETGEDFETPLKGEFDFAIVPAGRNGSSDRFERGVLAAMQADKDEDKATISGPIIFAGTKERKFAPREDGSENPEYTFFKNNYSDAFAKMLEEKGSDYIPTEFDLVQAQAEYYSGKLGREIVAVGASKADGYEYVSTYAVFNEALKYMQNRMLKNNPEEGEGLFASSKVAAATNQIYVNSNGPDMQRAVEQYGINKVFIAGIAATPKDAKKRNLTAYVFEGLKATDTSLDYVLAALLAA
jgi:hypothetical protein